MSILSRVYRPILRFFLAGNLLCDLALPSTYCRRSTKRNVGSILGFFYIHAHTLMKFLFSAPWRWWYKYGVGLFLDEARFLLRQGQAICNRITFSKYTSSSAILLEVFPLNYGSQKFFCFLLRAFLFTINDEKNYYIF